MPSLERFFPPIARFFDANVKSLPNARLYFYRANSTTLKATFKDKVGEIAHSNPVEADASGKFPPIFLSGLYRVELRSKNNVVQPGWPVDNVGQDSAIVPFAPWSEIVTYQEDDVVTSPDGFWFRSKVNDNIGLDPDDNSDEWELIVIPVAGNFTSNVPWATWSDNGTKISLNIDPSTFVLGTRQVASGDGLSGGGNLSQDRTLSVDATVARVQSSRVELNGNFASGSFVVCSKIGNVVTITADGNLSHASLSVGLSSTGAIPAAYRPSSDRANLYEQDGGDFLKVVVSSGGILQTVYEDSTGSAVTRTSALCPSITYVADTTA